MKKKLETKYVATTKNSADDKFGELSQILVERINPESRAKIMERLNNQKQAKGKGSSARKAQKPKSEAPQDDIEEFMNVLREYVELE